jgi:hypothetical protein
MSRGILTDESRHTRPGYLRSITHCLTRSLSPSHLLLGHTGPATLATTEVDLLLP